MTVRRIRADQLEAADLFVDAVYEGGRAGNAGDDPLPSLIGVSNQGGFRYLGNLAAPNLICLTSSLGDPDWPDHLDRGTGTFIYYGDNKRPGRGLHSPPRNGNRLLRSMFNAPHAKPPSRTEIPPVLVFGKAGTYRDMTFLGLAVPGTPDLPPMEDLVAIWKVAEERRFQNYRAALTILDVARVPRAWLDDVRAGRPLSENCPPGWKTWIETGSYQPLTAKASIEYRTKNEQIPSDAQSLERYCQVGGPCRGGEPVPRLSQAQTLEAASPYDVASAGLTQKGSGC